MFKLFTALISLISLFFVMLNTNLCAMDNNKIMSDNKLVGSYSKSTIEKTKESTEKKPKKRRKIAQKTSLQDEELISSVMQFKARTKSIKQRVIPAEIQGDNSTTEIEENDSATERDDDVSLSGDKSHKNQKTSIKYCFAPKSVGHSDAQVLYPHKSRTSTIKNKSKIQDPAYSDNDVDYSSEHEDSDEIDVSLFDKNFRTDLIPISQIVAATKAFPLSLSRAVCDRKASQVQTILKEHNYAVNEKNKHGQTALHIAVRMGLADIVGLLIKTVDVNARDDQQRTALHYAAGYRGDLKNYKIINQLISTPGIRLDIKDCDGRTQAQCASSDVKKRALKDIKTARQQIPDLLRELQEKEETTRSAGSKNKSRKPPKKRRKRQPNKSDNFQITQAENSQVNTVVSPVKEPSNEDTLIADILPQASHKPAQEVSEPAIKQLEEFALCKPQLKALPGTRLMNGAVIDYESSKVLKKEQRSIADTFCQRSQQTEVEQSRGELLEEVSLLKKVCVNDITETDTMDIVNAAQSQEVLAPISYPMSSVISGKTNAKPLNPLQLFNDLYKRVPADVKTNNNDNLIQGTSERPAITTSPTATSCSSPRASFKVLKTNGGTHCTPIVRLGQNQKQTLSQSFFQQCVQQQKQQQIPQQMQLQQLQKCSMVRPPAAQYISFKLSAQPSTTTTTTTTATTISLPQATINHSSPNNLIAADRAQANKAIGNVRADVNQKDMFGRTQLYLAVLSNDLAEVQALIAAGANVNLQEYYYGKTPLHWAAGRGLQEIVQALIAAGANVNLQAEDGKTPLHLAVMYGYPGVIKALITAGANVNLQAKDGMTPLHWAAQQGDLASS